MLTVRPAFLGIARQPPGHPSRQAVPAGLAKRDWPHSKASMQAKAGMDADRRSERRALAWAG